MVDTIRHEEILFLDIETVPQVAEFEELDSDFQLLWEEKSRFIRDRQEINIPKSYEQAGIYAEFGKIVCISAGYFAKQDGKQIFRVTSFYGHDENSLLISFAKLLTTYQNNPFKVLCAHNGKEFDFPYMCRRMLIHKIPLPKILDIAGKKPWEIPHIDTMELWKFGDYKHYTSLKLLAKIFQIPTPKSDIDGSMVRSVYYDENDLQRIMVYCQKDVITIARLFMCYQGSDFFKEEDIRYV